MPADLCDTTFRRKISLENHETASRLQGLLKRNNHFLSRGLDRALALDANRLPCDGLRRRVQIFPIDQSLRQQSNASCAMHVRSHEASRGLEIGEQRSASADRLEILNVQLNSRFARNRQQVQNRIGRSARRRNGRDRIFESVARENIAGLDSVLQHVHHNLAAGERDVVFQRIHRWNAIEAHRRKPDHLHHR